MKTYLRFLVLSSLLAFFPACKGEKSPEAQRPEGNSATQAGEMHKASGLSRLSSTARAVIDYLRIREQPDLDAASAGNFRLGDEVQLTGEITNFSTPVRLRGLTYDDPWVGVVTADGKKAWAYGGGLGFRDSPKSVVAETLMHKRLVHFLGQELAEELTALSQRFQNLNCDSTAFAERQKKALGLRPQIEQALNRHFSPGSSDKLPDFYWLESNFPTFFVQYDKTDKRLRIFQNYKALARLAKSCPGSTDDDLAKWYFLLYPQDSMETKYPVYVLEDFENQKLYNTLGDGKTARLFEAMGELSAESDLYDDLLMQWKAAWLEDLRNSNLPFWHDPEDVHSEINTILGVHSSLFTEKEQAFLRSLPEQ